MAKLYPPYINGTIPAFYQSKGTTSTQIVVPFTMNKAVAAGEVAGFALKIKETNGDVKGVVLETVSDIYSSLTSVTFSPKNMTFIVGQYYKVQLAYIDKNGTIGYYSTVGIIKCTTKPVVKIEGLKSVEVNTHNYSYTGVYSQLGGDVTEKMYSYKFLLYDSDENVIIDSGEKLHNTSLDSNSFESHEEFRINRDLDFHNSYYIQFVITTMNQLTVESERYRIIQRHSIAPDITADLLALMDFNNGYVVLSVHDEVDSVISGNFLISRASSKTNYQWEELKRFDFHSMDPNKWTYKDYTVEQGVTYKYSIQQYNVNNIYSERIVSNKIMVDFEDMFLYDGKRQLRIRYNPKVSTYKTDVLEAKTDTIGSQYPYFSRNGNVYYKEFALSGLISYLADEDENFVSMQELGLDGYSSDLEVYGKYKTTNLLDYNIAAERIFKNIVLDWLNDGQVKLFKSPAEGNYLVRLMNASLSPMDQVARMLHTFSVNAYEVAECNDENLTYYGMIDPSENLETQTRWVTVDIRSAVNSYLQSSGKTLEQAIQDKDEINLLTRQALSIDLKDLVPGAHVNVTIIDGNGSAITENIQIGVTGAYYFELAKDQEALRTVSYVIDTVNDGQLTYSYQTQGVTVFGLINDMTITDVPIRQFVGMDYKDKALNCWDSTLQTFLPSANLMDSLNDARTTVLSIVFVRAEKRSVDTLFIYNPGGDITAENFDFARTYYKDIYCTEVFNWETDVDPLAIYRIRYRANTSPYDRQKNYKYYVDANLDQFSTLTNICIDGFNKKVFAYHDDMFSFKINNEYIDLTETEKFFVKNHDVELNSIESNDGVIVEVSYSEQIKIYNIEDVMNSPRYPELFNAARQYKIDVDNMITAHTAARDYNISQLKTDYRIYLTELNKALDKYKEEHGLVI